MLTMRCTENVNKPLAPVKRVCVQGNRVNFDDGGSFIQNKATGEVAWMKERNGVYVIECWVWPRQECDDGAPAFGRRGTAQQPRRNR